MAKKKWFWVPTEDTATIGRIQIDIDNETDCAWLTDWSLIKSGDDLCISGHGSPTNPSEIFGTDEGANVAYTITYTTLAQAIVDGINDSKLSFQIKIYICHSADRVKVGNKQLCFAGQLLSALKGHGYKKIKIAAYHGELYLKRGTKPNKVVCTLKTNPGTFVGTDVKKFMGITYVDRKGYSAAKYHREWFTNKPFGTRWL